jgi:hypothetical protein
MAGAATLFSKCSLEQGLDDCLAADIQARRLFIQLSQHALCKIDVHSPNRTDDRKLSGEVARYVFPLRSHFCDLVNRDLCFRRFPDSSAPLLLSPAKQLSAGAEMLGLVILFLSTI